MTCAFGIPRWCVLLEAERGNKNHPAGNRRGGVCEKKRCVISRARSRLQYQLSYVYISIANKGRFVYFFRLGFEMIATMDER